MGSAFLRKVSGAFLTLTFALRIYQSLPNTGSIEQQKTLAATIKGFVRVIGTIKLS